MVKCVNDFLDDNVFIGFLRPDVPDDEQVIPDVDVWVCASIKSML